MLIEVFEFVPEETAHVPAPAADPGADAFDGQHLIDEGHLEETH